MFIYLNGCAFLLSFIHIGLLNHIPTLATASTELFNLAWKDKTFNKRSKKIEYFEWFISFLINLSSELEESFEGIPICFKFNNIFLEEEVGTSWELHRNSFRWKYKKFSLLIHNATFETCFEFWSNIPLSLF